MQRITGHFNWLPNWIGRGQNVLSGSVAGNHHSSHMTFTTGANANNVVAMRGIHSDFDSARQTRTASETRPVNINFLPCIRFKLSNAGGGGGGIDLSDIPDRRDNDNTGHAANTRFVTNAIDNAKETISAITSTQIDALRKSILDEIDLRFKELSSDETT